MRVEDLSTKALLVGVLTVVIAGCSGSDDGDEGYPAATGGAQAVGGAAMGETGGVDSTAVSPTGSGGATGTGGSSGLGGLTSAGGTSGGTGGATPGNTGSGGAHLGGSGSGVFGSGGRGLGGSGSGGRGPIGSGTGGSGLGGVGSGGPAAGGSATGGFGSGGAPLGGASPGGSGAGGGATTGSDSGGTHEGGSAGEGRGGASQLGGGAAGEGTGGTDENGGAASGGESSGGIIDPGECTESQSVRGNARGSGPHEVVIEANSDSGINEGTIYRPADLGGDEKYPIFVWGEGACSRNGFSNEIAMTEIASQGYFVVADGPPSGGAASISMSSDVVGMARPLLAYITWAIAENGKPCSAYYQSLDTTKIAANGFSCGGLMAEGTAGDSRMTTWGITSSGLTGASPGFYETIHTPVLVILGGPSDVAYENGERDYDNISALGHPIMLFSKDIGHGGDLGASRGGDFTKINLAWLNWWLKGDEGATGKGVLVGAGCTYCTDGAWEVKSANLN